MNPIQAIESTRNTEPDTPQGCPHTSLPERLGQLQYLQRTGVPPEGDGVIGKSTRLCHCPRAMPHAGKEPHQGILGLSGATYAGLASAT